MAYYFAVETEENSYVAKNIRYSKYFGADGYIYNKSEKYECTLGEIDRLTTEFKDETVLKECLLKENIITESDLDKKIAIIFAKGIERRIVGGNLLYSDSKTMLEYPMDVVEYIKNQAKDNNYHFFRELSKKLPNGTINKSLVSKLASLIENKLAYEDSDELNDKLIEEVAKLLIYRSSVNENGSIVCNDKINTENFHNVLSFISEYEKTLVKNIDHTKTLKNTSN